MSEWVGLLTYAVGIILMAGYPLVRWLTGRSFPSKASEGKQYELQEDV